MILFGLRGSGVSSTANTILGIGKMKTDIGFDQTTVACCIARCTQPGYRLTIVDVPGFNTDISNNPSIDVFGDLKSGIEMLKPGPNVLIIVIPVDRYDSKTKLFVSCLQCLQGISKYTIIVFTKADGDSTKDHRREISQSEHTRGLLNLSEERFVLFNNKVKDEKQVKDLMEFVRKITDSEQKKYFDSSIFPSDCAKKLKKVISRDRKQTDATAETFKKQM